MKGLIAKLTLIGALGFTTPTFAEDARSLARADSLRLYTSSLNSGRSYSQNGEYSLAIDSFTLAQELGEKLQVSGLELSFIHANLANIHYKQKNNKKQLEEAEKAYELMPFNFINVNNLAFALALNNTGLERALSLSEQAINTFQDTPLTGQFYDTLGFVQFQMKDYEGALASLLYASQNIDPETEEGKRALAFNHFYIAQALRILGKPGLEDYLVLPESVNYNGEE